MNSDRHWRMTEYGWRHSPTPKVVVNTILRALQLWSDRPFLVYTKCVIDGDSPPKTLGYGLGRIRVR